MSSGALDDVRRYDSTDGAYEHIYAGRTSSMTADGPDVVAAAIADAAQAPDVRLRVPVGASAAAVLAARKAAPEDVPFRP